MNEVVIFFVLLISLFIIYLVMTSKSKISVIIPTHNRPELLKRAVQSVLNQSFQDFEIIVVDDGLEKRANKIIEKINDKRVFYFQNKQNLGASASRNIGIKKSKGEFITFLDDDDEFYPNKLEKQYKVIQDNLKKIDFVYCLADIYSQQSGEIISTQNHNLRGGIQNLFEEALALNIAIAMPSIFCKKNKVLEIGGFDEGFSNAEDKDFFLKLSKNSLGFFQKEALVKVNLSQDESSRLSGNLISRISGRELLIKKYKDELNKRPQILSKHLFLLALLYQENRNFKKANQLFFQSWKLNRCDVKFPKQILKNLYLEFFNKTFNKKSN